MEEYRIMKTKLFTISMLVLLLVALVPNAVMAQGSDVPEFANGSHFRRLTGPVMLFDDASTGAATLMTVTPEDKMEILTEDDGDWVLVNVYREADNDDFVFVGFGWVEHRDDFMFTYAESVVESDCTLETGGVQVYDNIVHFGEGWAWSAASTSCNVLLEGRGLNQTDDTHHYWAVRDRDPSDDDAQVTRYTHNRVATFIEGAVWIYPVTWNMSDMRADDPPIFLEFARQKDDAGVTYPMVIHDVRGSTIGITDEMIEGVVPEAPDSYDELTSITVSGLRQDDEGHVIASVGSNGMCWVVIGQTDTDEAIEVERHCGMDETFSFYTTDTQPTFFWVLPDLSTHAEAAEMVMPELASYIADFVGAGIGVDVEFLGFGSQLDNDSYRVGLAD